ncbi:MULTISPECIES: KEOPS complex subunit Pcc1 [unclassified Haladaptatus]|uniref:KEOPS complex subunit Pcc1 n=1 Tax=unclassified Haladaptatus TaxID=2622732 RepID=UPI00209BC62E|nr:MULTISPECIES: KEOPS complex subunit Pcc1 [unclassified Haladaptatus]MCO8243888.1 KEOPS complex Pcc1-like subunit [Haladaptatus sp. AB643]MCO8256423.1 KEOPS complex Pcc1-like subunit [Haladaptatus sp. AB618]
MRRATIHTELEDAEHIAAAVVPDNTPEIETSVEDGTITTTIERETTGGLQTTIDDYVVNLSVAAQVVQTANQHTNTNYE